jgi:hypothetical protein
MNRRLTLGLISVGLLVTGVVLFVVDRNHALSGPCIKVGLVTLAACIAYRDMEKVSLWMLGAALMAIAVVAWRPRSVVVVVPVLIAFWFLRPRTSKPRPPRGA